MSTPIVLKGSLFDEAPIGAIVYPGSVPQVGDVLELEGKSFTITDLIREDGGTAGPGDEGQTLIAIVEPLAISQRRGAAAKGPAR